MEHRKRLGRNLRKVRVAQHMTQEDLAGLARVDRTTVSGIERGDFNASVDLLARLADALSADISAFFVIPESDERPEPLKSGRKPSR